MFNIIRQKRFFRTICIIIALAIVAGFSAIGGADMVVKASEQTKTVDLYVIAGQSNASGYSEINGAKGVSTENKKGVYSSGFSNIYMYGRADNNTFNSAASQSGKVTVKFGQGASSSAFGAEIGMADIISEYNSDNETAIYKYAVGGSYLVNNTTHQVSLSSGNWCPPSMCKEGDSGYNANITGKLFREWKAGLKKVVDSYTAAGYAVNLCGTFWMQGEAEASNSAEYSVYDTYLTALINEMRNEYGALNLANSKTAPFVVGLISRSFANGGIGVDAIRAKQNVVATAMAADEVYAMETYDIFIGGENVGKDAYHFNGNDMLSIGKDVGNLMLNTATKGRIIVKITGKGTSDISSRLLEGTPVTVTFTPEAHWRISEATLDGEDVLAQINNNAYTSPSSGKHVLEVTFTEEAKYVVTVENDSAKGSYSRNPASVKYYKNTEVKITVTPKEGYVVAFVKYNGAEITPNDGKYIITVGETNTVAIGYTALTEPHECKHKCEICGKCTDENCTDEACVDKCKGHTSEKSSSGCGGNIGGGAVAGFALLSLAVFSIIKKKRI